MYTFKSFPVESAAYFISLQNVQDNAGNRKALQGRLNVISAQVLRSQAGVKESVFNVKNKETLKNLGV
jgi:hypothetical protein